MGLGIRRLYRYALEGTLGARTQRAGTAARENLLRRFRPDSIPVRPSDNRLLVSIVGTKQIPELQVSLATMCLSSPSLPELRVFSDLRTHPDLVREALEWWPGKLSVSGGAEALENAINVSPLLADFAGAHLHGMKFAACTLISRERDCVFSDSDLLWFQNSSHLWASSTREIDAPSVAMSADIAVNLAPALYPFFPRSWNIRTPLNSGVMRLQGDLLKIDTICSAIAAAINTPDLYFSEQTLFAIACARTGGSVWPQSVINLSAQEYYSARKPKANPSYTARHYAGKYRALFWLHGLALLEQANCLE